MLTSVFIKMIIHFLKMTSTQVVEMSVNVTVKSLSQDDTHPDDHNLCTYYCTVYDMTPGFKPFTFIPLLLLHMLGSGIIPHSWPSEPQLSCVHSIL